MKIFVQTWREYFKQRWPDPLAIIFLTMIALQLVVAQLFPVVSLAAYIIAVVLLVVTVLGALSDYWEVRKSL